MWGEKTFQILKTIGEATIDMTDLLTAFLNAGYGAPPSRIEYERFKLQKQRWQKQVKLGKQKEKLLLEKKQRQRFYEIMSRLEKDGLVNKTHRKDKKFFCLTLKGRKRLSILKNKMENTLPSPSLFKDKKFKDNKNNRFIVVTFDIPETERPKRDWLREVLENLGLKFLQKSVWVGIIKIPEELLECLKQLQLVEYVEIFEINKTGILRQIT